LHPELLGLIIILFPLVFARLDFSLHTLLYTLLPLAHQLVLLQLQQLPLHLIDGPHMLFVYRQFLAILVFVIFRSLTRLLQNLEEIIVLYLLIVHVDGLVDYFGGHRKVEFIDFLEGWVAHRQVLTLDLVENLQ
jgi:hypothetical protein